ncbi:MAG: hypothetical protein ACRD6W_03405 [Nitrososphaerales archaeon]
MRLLLPDIQVLGIVALPAREPYPPTELATLFQRDTGDVLKLVCADCGPALRLAEAPATLELRGRSIETSESGRTFKFVVTGIAESGGDRGE